MPHPDAYQPDNAVRITEEVMGGLARCAVVDQEGFQLYPKPGMLDTLSACQEFILRNGVLESTYTGTLS